MLKIGFIGYRNHSYKVLKIVDASKFSNEIVIYHPSKSVNINLKKSYKFTNNLNDLLSCSCIFITSPNETHVEYLKKFYKKKYIFCEKTPCVNFSEYKFLKKIKNKYKKKILFNFHLLNTSFFNELKNFFKKKNIGQLQHISIFISHGAMLKNKLNKSRHKDTNGFSNIFGNLGIHYLRLILEFIKIKKIKTILKSYNKSKITDTSYTTIVDHKNKIHNIFLSYSSPLSNYIKIYFSNIILFYDDGKFFTQGPRDIFDKKGLFIKSRQKIKFNYKNSIDHNSKGLQKRIDYFLNTVFKKKFFDVNDYVSSINSSKFILKSFDK